MNFSPIFSALAHRENNPSFVADVTHRRAFRAFNGFTEGNPDWVLEIYGHTLVLHDYRKQRTDNTAHTLIVDAVVSRWSWLTCAIVKQRFSTDAAERNGLVFLGSEADLTTSIVEDKVQYAVQLTLNRDCSFYLDTRVVREWLRANSNGCAVLNFFAYTGSLGIAALAGGARDVTQVDRNERFLAIAKRSVSLNKFAKTQNHRNYPVEFFAAVSKLKQRAQQDPSMLFDRVVLDPPFQTDSSQGKLDTELDTVRLINKVRPLLADNGMIVFVNNALYLSGAQFNTAIEEVCKGDYVTREKILDVDNESRGFSDATSPVKSWPEDPAPYNHPTKIVVLRVRRKS